MSERPSGLARNPTAPPVMANGHFAAVGDNGDAASYEHGVQVIGENKEFKYAGTFPRCAAYSYWPAGCPFSCC